MDVRNCRICGRIFNYMGGDPLCPSCIKVMEDKFIEVKAYIYEHPGAGVQEVAEENDVHINQINKWIREERLCFSEDSAVGIECEKCGTMIRTGRFCSKCKDQMANNFSTILQVEPPQPEKKNSSDLAKIRFLNK